METLRLEQKRFGRGRQTFELRKGEDCVRVSTSSHERGAEYKVPLEILSPDFNRIRERSFKPMLYACIFGAACLLMAVAGVNEPAAAILAVPIGIVAAYCAFAWYRDSVDMTVFFNRFSGKGALAIWNGKPTEAACSEFCKAVVEAAKKFEPKTVASSGDSPADQLRKFSQLFKEGVISEQEFAETKARLLALPDKREIGFHSR